MKHLEKQNISYIEHFIRALKHAIWCIKMCAVCIMHAVFPFWLTSTFSDEVKKMASEIERKK